MLHSTAIPSKSNLFSIISENIKRRFPDSENENEEITNTSNPFQNMHMMPSSETNERYLRKRATRNNQSVNINGIYPSRESTNQLMGVVAHDLKNPMIGIRGIAEILLEDGIGEMTSEQKEMIGRIVSGSNSVLQLIEELLDVASIRSGKLQLQLEKASFSEIVTESVQLNSIHAAQKNITIVVENKAEMDTLKCDSSKVRQVIDNLLSNAVKYSPAATSIKAILHSKNGRIGFSVLDEGPGIPEDEKHHIFQDFGRTSVQPTGGEKSTGLGLAICRYIVRAHGGTISFKNLPEKGCSFTVYFPTHA